MKTRLEYLAKNITHEEYYAQFVSFPGPGCKMRECGDFPTLAGAVCILKCAARNIVLRSQ